MQIRCRNCGVARNVPDYHGTLLVTCPECDWQETLPARRHLPESLDNLAGHAFTALAERETTVHEVVERLAALSSRRFERFCAAMFAADGYDVTVADQMMDQSHVLELRSGSEMVFVACASGAHPAQVADVERLAGSMRHGGAARAIFVSPGTFDAACQNLALRDGLELIDEQALLAKLLSVPLDQLRAWIAPARSAESAS